MKISKKRIPKVFVNKIIKTFRSEYKTDLHITFSSLLCSSYMDYIQILETIFFFSYWYQLCLILLFSWIYQFLIITKPLLEWSFFNIFRKNKYISLLIAETGQFYISTKLNYIWAKDWYCITEFWRQKSTNWRKQELKRCTRTAHAALKRLSWIVVNTYTAPLQFLPMSHVYIGYKKDIFYLFIWCKNMQLQ